MKKIRILALILALLMLPLSVLVGCKKPDGDDDSSECNNHKWNNEVISKRDCVTPGVTKKTCRKCGKVEMEEKSPWDHYFPDPVSDNNASCTEDGTKTSTCSRCTATQTVADVGSALGHTFPDSRYTVVEEDEFVEKAVCVKCEAATDYRLLGLNIDFEGDKSHLSYTKLEEYFVEGAGSIETKTEGEGDDANSYLSITRDDSIFAGSSAFGLILKPRAEMLKGTSIASAPYYVVEFDIRISATDTKDLILLSGTKNGATENFLKYNSEDGTLVTAAGVVYMLKASDYDRWLKISLVLNDGSKEYTVYVDGYQMVFSDNEGTYTEIAYSTVDGYYLGYNLENFRIGLVAEVGVASKFDIDNIKHYLGTQPEGYKGSADAEYFIYTTVNGDKIVYKLADADCQHVWGDTTVVPHTCQSTGYRIHTCTLCGGQEIFEVSTDALSDHDFQNVSIIPADCDNAEYHTEACSVCRLKNGYSVGEKLGHELDRTEGAFSVTAPTCTEKGYTTGLCVRCNAEMTVDYVSELGHEIDYEDTDSYKVYEPDCVNGGYTEGKCKRCDKTDYQTDFKDALGHEINPDADDYVKVEADCETEGYEESTCLRCDTVYKPEESVVKAYGHNIVSEIKEVPVSGSATGETKRVIASKCTRCADASSERDVSTNVPAYAEVVGIVGADNMLGKPDATDLLYFDTLIGNSYGSLTESAGSTYGLVTRYSKFVIKEDGTGTGKGYAEWTYAPQNGYDSEGKLYTVVKNGKTEDISAHSYFDVSVKPNASGVQQTETGKDVTFEMSLRIPAGATEMIPLSINAMDRSGMHFKDSSGKASNHDVPFLSVSETGRIYLVSGVTVGQVTTGAWTRIAIVFHTTNATYDVYVDGVMVEKNVMIEITDSSDASKRAVLVNQLAFEVINHGFRVNAGGNSAKGVTRKLDVDEVYVYYASVPAYVTDVKINEKSGMSAFEETMNLTDGYTASYLNAFSLYNSALQINTKLAVKQNTRYFIDAANGNALHLIKNSSITSVPGASDGTDTHIDINIAHGGTTSADYGNIGRVLYQYKSIVFETEFTINEGTGNITLLRGRKTVGSTKNEQLFLEYKNGNIVAGGSDVVVSGVETGRKYTLAVVMREDSFNYDVYVDGLLVRERIPYTSAYCVDNIRGDVMFRAFHVSGDADLLIHSVNIYGGKETPLLNIGRSTFVKVDGQFVTSAVVFSENYDYSVHYPSQKRANGDYVYNSSKSALTLVKGYENASGSVNDLGLGLIKIDKDGNTGDAAVNEPVWALKTGNWGANCDTTSGETDPLKFYPQNVPMNGNYYNFSGYETITFKYYVAESAGYKFLITMGCPKTDNKNCYYTYYVTIPAGTTGWQELTLKFTDFGKNNTVSLDKIESINFNFSGGASSGVGTPSENRPGKLGSGTTLYIEGIYLNSKTTEKIVGQYVENLETFCGEGNHTLGEIVTVEPSAHIDGYSYKACSADGCGYVELVEELEGTALGHVVSGDPNADSVGATCGADGKLFYNVTCDSCGNMVIGGKTYKTGHKWEKDETGDSLGADCVTDGYETYVCKGSCQATAKLTISATGHTKDENVESVITPADCINGGYTTSHCSVCNEDYIHDEINALGHDVIRNVVQEGNCDEDRIVDLSCSRCDWTDTETTATLGHNWDVWQTVTPATCADGLERRDCKDCDHFEENVIAGTGRHSYTKVETPADCGNNGERVWTCSGCGDSYSEVLVATGDHKYGTEILRKESSATEEGYTYYECTVCERHKVIDTIPAIFDGTEDLKFDISGDTAIVEKYTGTATEIVIPGTYAGKPVVVSANAFKGNTSITSVTVGDGATVAQSAFKGCTALKTVVLGEGMTKINLSTFEGCTELETIVLPVSITAVDINAFKDCDALTTVNYAGAAKLVAGGNFKANGNDKFFAATWNCNYEA